MAINKHSKLTIYDNKPSLVLANYGVTSNPTATSDDAKFYYSSNGSDVNTFVIDVKHNNSRNKIEIDNNGSAFDHVLTANTLKSGSDGTGDVIGTWNGEIIQDNKIASAPVWNGLNTNLTKVYCDSNRYDDYTEDGTLGAPYKTLKKALEDKLESTTTGNLAFTLSVHQSNYIFNSITTELQPTINLIRGFTYTFALDSSGHPFRIQTQSNNTNGTLYNTGLSHSGGDTGSSAQNKSDGTLTFAVPLDAPDILYYQCQNHASMYGQFNVMDFTYNFVLAAGTYSGVIDLDSRGSQNFIITGSGMYNTFIKGSPSWDNSIGDVLYFKNFNNVIVKDVTIMNAQFGCNFSSCNFVRFDSVKFLNLGASNSSDNFDLTKTKTQKQTIWASNTNNDGGAVYCQSCQEVNVINSEISQCTTGLKLQNCNKGLINNNYFNKTIKSAIVLNSSSSDGNNGCNNFNITNNHIDTINTNAIIIIGGKNNYITNNNILNIANTGIQTVSALDTIIRNNNIHNANLNSYNGIGIDSLYAYGSLVIDGNTNIGTGNYMAVIQNNTLTSCNQGASTSVIGINIKSSAYPTASNKIIKDDNNSDATNKFVNTNNIPLITTKDDTTLDGIITTSSGSVFGNMIIADGSITTSATNKNISFSDNNISSGGTVTFTGNTQIDGTLDINNTSDFNNTITCSKSSGYGIDVTNDAIIRNDLTVSNDLIVTKNLTINGTTTTINSTVLTVDDKNIEIGSVDTPTDTTANLGGITLKGATDKTITWDATNGWMSNQQFSVGTAADGVTMTTSGAITSQGNASIGGTLGVTGATTLSSTLGVTDATTLSSTLGVTGIATMNNTTDSSDINTGSLVVKGGLGVNKKLYVGSDSDFTGNLNNNLTNSTYFTIKDSGSIKFRISNTGKTEIIGDLDINDKFTVDAATGDTVIESNTNSSGHTSGALIVKGGVGIHGSINVNGNIDVTNNISATSGDTNLRNLEISGNRNTAVSNDGCLLNLDTTTITDASADSGDTISKFVNASFKAPVFNTSQNNVTTTTAANVHIDGAPTCNNGNNTLSNSYALWVENGDVKVNNAIEAQRVIAVSDKTLKKNIQPLNDSLNTIHKLKGVSYDWIDDNNHDHEIGLIAQDVEEVVPEVVRRLGNSDFKGIEYQKLTALLIEAVKELSNEINLLKSKA